MDKDITEKAKEKERYSPPELEMLHFASDDIIATSLPDERTDKLASKCFSGKIYWDD